MVLPPALSDLVEVETTRRGFPAPIAEEPAGLGGRRTAARNPAAQQPDRDALSARPRAMPSGTVPGASLFRAQESRGAPQKDIGVCG